MKYVKSLRLLFSITVAALALAAPASATSLTSSAGTTPTTAWTTTSTELHGAFTTVKCGHFHWHQQATTHGFGWFVKWHTTTFSWKNCNYPVTAQAGGVVSAEAAATTGNATLRSEGMKITVHTSVGECVFTTNGTDIGTLTGSNNTGGNAQVDITAVLPRTGGNFLCGSTATWTGNATITTPSSLAVH